MVKVFVSGPYTKGDVGENVGESMKITNTLISLGYAPYCPLLNHFLHIMYPHSWDSWMKLDIAYLKICDVVLRLPGESKGADIEIEQAIINKIPVCYSLKELFDLKLK